MRSLFYALEYIYRDAIKRLFVKCSVFKDRADLFIVCLRMVFTLSSQVIIAT